MTQESTALAVQSPVALVTIGQRTLSTRGWNLVAFDEHLTTHLTDAPRRQWCEVACLARTMFGRSTPDNRRWVQAKLGHAFRMMLRRGYFVVIEYAQGPQSHGEAVACKLLPATGATEQERQYATYQLTRMRRRKEITEETFTAAQQILRPSLTDRLG